MKKFKFVIQGNNYEVEILSIEDNIAEINVNGSVYNVELQQEIKTPKTPKLVRSVAVPGSEPDKVRTSKPTDVKGGGVIKAPLPGTILEIFVKPIDKVNIGDKLLIMEAMKMENNINSDKSGVVKAVKVNVQDSVMEGDVLVEIGE